MIDLGTVKPGSTIRIPFSTFDKDDGSAITQTNYAAADILVYKDGGTTERASTAGFTATTDFDSKTGKQLAAIDLADNTTAGFYSAGSEYLVAIDSVTVDGVTTGGWIARFRIGYPGAAHDTTIASLTNQTSFTLTAGPAEDDALNGWIAVIHDVASAVQCGHALVSDYTGSTKTITLAAGTTFTAAASDNISFFPPNLLFSGTAAGLLSFTSGILSVNTTQFNGSNVTAASGRPEVNATHAAGTAWNSGAIGASTLASDTITAAKIAADAITAAKIADGAIDRATFAADTGLQTVRSNTAQAGAAGTITLDASASSTTDFYVGCWVFLTGGTGAGQARVITAYNGTSKVATIAPNWATNPDNTSTFAVIPAAQVTGVQGNVTGSVATLTNAPSDSSGVTTLLSRVGTPSDLGGGASLSANLADIESQTDDIGAAGAGLTALASAANLATVAGYLDTEIAAIKAETDKLADTLEDQGGGTYGFTAAALQEGPSGSGLDAAGVRDAIGLASANLDAQLADIPTVSEMNARTLASASYATASAQSTAQTSLDDIPTNAELAARTLPAADYATAAGIAGLNDISAAEVKTQARTALQEFGAIE